MQFGLTFHVKESEGIPGAVIVKNLQPAEFFLKLIIIDDFPDKSLIHFDCISWVYNVGKYTYDRVFFSNHSYLPKDIPNQLRSYTEEELRYLRGDDVNMKLEWDRVYNYAYFNDLGNIDRVPISHGRFSVGPLITLTPATVCGKPNIGMRLYFWIMVNNGV
ncbi:Linoleate 9S-lipoxygenase-4 [Platanthera zijinensis]|uniref:Linoleate 9S-lipoxygenase-4 n=1 Tax=Platanthera zijinensis TaxID=2320716 RepID=A0AAP0BA65_9ASPA